MIHEQTVYKCKCDKCRHEWLTKAFVVPDRCAKCNRVTWNENSKPVAKCVPVEVVETEDDSLDEWQGWSEEQEEYNGATGETIIFRKQLVKPFRIQEIRREH